MDRRYLPEIPERDAPPAVREIYADIRQTLGLPVVNLVYRHLAAEPGRLEAVWSGLARVIGEPGTEALAVSLSSSVGVPDVAPLSADVLVASGVGEVGLAGVRATLSVYARGNSLNLIGCSALLEGVDSPGEAVDPAVTFPPVSPEELPPLADVALLAAPVRSLLEEMSIAVAGGEEPILVPTLFRHLAHDPAVLELGWTALRPAFSGGEIAALAAVVEEAARDLATCVPGRVERLHDPGSRAVLAGFLGPMARMLVVGAALDRAFGPRTP